MVSITVLHQNPLMDGFNRHTLLNKQYYLVNVLIDKISFEKAILEGFDPELHEEVNKGTKIYVFHNNTNEYKHYSELKKQ